MRYPVAATKRAYWSLVTSVSSIQNPSTDTRWTGSESVNPSRSPEHIGSPAPRPERKATVVSAAGPPIENSPPPIHTIPTGATFSITALVAAAGASGSEFCPQPNPIPRADNERAIANRVRTELCLKSGGCMGLKAQDSSLPTPPVHTGPSQQRHAHRGAGQRRRDGGH